MASLIRIGVGRIMCPTGTKVLLAPKFEVTLARSISGKALRSQDPDRPKKPAPYNYKAKSYTNLHALFDKTSSRFDENSKILVVEGPPAAGKTKLAKELAEELDMLYLPEANLSMLYINSYGYDLRQLDDQLPISCRSFDIKDFLRTPKHVNTLAFQIKQYRVKYEQYIDALAHLLSTGQGVVLDRCVYSDFAFTEAMASQGYISKPGRQAYYDIRKNTIGELLRPHLIIYLDTPVKTCLENIKKRNLQCEKGSPVLTPEYLGVLEKFYKQHYLKEINRFAELLVYDWSDGGEVEVVVEDIERINFEVNKDHQDPKFADWKQDLEEEWAVLRHK